MEIIEYGNRNADTVLLQPVDGHDLYFIEDEISVIRKGLEEDLRFIAFRVSDWNRDLSPWNAPAVFGGYDFGCGAAETLGQIIKVCDDRSKSYFIGGYSLAGLFSLWAAYQTGLFRGVAAASPSVWFPGFTEYIGSHWIKSRCVYLSLGDKEEKARNKVMATVGEKIRETYKILKEQKADCILEWNDGGHFKEAGPRTARAFRWVLARKQQKAEFAGGMMKSVIGTLVKGIIDRPVGSHHPEYTEMIYPVNYGYVEGVFAGDGAEQDVYVLGTDRPLLSFEGKVIAVYHRFNDDEDKWIVSLDGKDYTDAEILEKIGFQEKYFEGKLFR